jgi:hypothetical protein
LIDALHKAVDGIRIGKIGFDNILPVAGWSDIGRNHAAAGSRHMCV